MLIIWITVFIVALAVMVKGADWFLDSAEKVGLALGLSPFVVGVTIVGMGTSLPELISSFMATMQGVTEIVVANVVGSNIANILLIVGLSAVVGKRLTVTKNLIDLDLPLLTISSAIFIGVAYDRQIVFWESILLLVACVIFLIYTSKPEEESADIQSMGDIPDIIPAKKARRQMRVHEKKKEMDLKKVKVSGKDFWCLLIGVVLLLLGAKYVVEAVIKISEILKINPGVISITAVAIGTSLPELLVSVKAALNHKPDVALGNIFGSNIFNMLAVVGIPGLFTRLVIDEQTLSLGIPVLIMATLVFVISGISRKIHIWEGAMYLMLYVLFISKLLNLF